MWKWQLSSLKNPYTLTATLFLFFLFLLNNTTTKRVPRPALTTYRESLPRANSTQLPPPPIPTEELQNDVVPDALPPEPEEESKAESIGECDVYEGRWVRDESYPIYEAGKCPYVDEAFDCQGNGRADSDYLKWRWKPDQCQLPRFNATDFLLRLRGKRLMLVGDSMNRNQFESLLCLLREGLSDKSRMYETHGRRITKGRGYFVFKFVVIMGSCLVICMLLNRVFFSVLCSCSWFHRKIVITLVN